MKTVNGFDNLNEILNILNSGGLIIFPCETVYGVACDSKNKEAVLKLNQYKKRPLGKPYAIMCSSKSMATEYVNLNNTALDLYDKFLPGPVTVISEDRGNLAQGIASELKTVGVRIPDYKPMLRLIEAFGRPIVATSANASYQKRPYKISDIFENISENQKELIDLVIDVGELPKNEPSTVIDTTIDNTAVTLRQGDIKLKDKNEVLSRGEENTMNVAKELWQKYEDYFGKRAIVYALEGDMGAGKTHFVKGLGKAMGIKQDITSPSYDLINNYGKLIHIDTWRMLDANQELSELNLKDLITDKCIVAIEWANRAENLIRSYAEDAIIVWVKFEYGKNENDRLISWGSL